MFGSAFKNLKNVGGLMNLTGGVHKRKKVSKINQFNPEELKKFWSIFTVMFQKDEEV